MFRTTFFGEVNYFTPIWFSIPIFYLQAKGSIRCLFHSCMNLSLCSLSSTAQDFYMRGAKKSVIIRYCCSRFSHCVRLGITKTEKHVFYIVDIVVFFLSFQPFQHKYALKLSSFLPRWSHRCHVLQGCLWFLRLCAAVSWSCGFIQTCAIYINGQKKKKKSPLCDWSLLVLLQASLRHHPLCKTNKVSLLWTGAGPTGRTVPCCVKGHLLHNLIMKKKEIQNQKGKLCHQPLSYWYFKFPFCSSLCFPTCFTFHMTAGVCVLYFFFLFNCKSKGHG